MQVIMAGLQLHHLRFILLNISSCIDMYCYQLTQKGNNIQQIIVREVYYSTLFEEY